MRIGFDSTLQVTIFAKAIWLLFLLSMLMIRYFEVVV